MSPLAFIDWGHVNSLFTVVCWLMVWALVIACLVIAGSKQPAVAAHHIAAWRAVH